MIKSLCTAVLLSCASVVGGASLPAPALLVLNKEEATLTGYALLEKCRSDHGFGYKIMHRLVGVVSERLQYARMQVLDMYSPIAKKAGA